jgi:hypothetical protein
VRRVEGSFDETERDLNTSYVILLRPLGDTPSTLLLPLRQNPNGTGWHTLKPYGSMEPQPMPWLPFFTSGRVYAASPSAPGLPSPGACIRGDKPQHPPRTFVSGNPGCGERPYNWVWDPLGLGH